MNFNNRLSSTLANNIKLSAKKEYQAEKLTGGNLLWLVSRPQGVKLYINSVPDFNSAMVLNEGNRGYQWKNLSEYGIYKQYDNFYLWSIGINNKENIELQISSNAGEIEPILGNSSEKIPIVENLESIKMIEDASDSFYAGASGIKPAKIIPLASFKPWVEIRYVNSSWDKIEYIDINKDYFNKMPKGERIFSRVKVYFGMFIDTLYADMLKNNQSAEYEITVGTQGYYAPPIIKTITGKYEMLQGTSWHNVKADLTQNGDGFFEFEYMPFIQGDKYPLLWMKVTLKNAQGFNYQQDGEIFSISCLAVQLNYQIKSIVKLYDD